MHHQASSKGPIRSARSGVAAPLHLGRRREGRLLATNTSVARVTLAVVMFPHGARTLLGWFGGFGFEGTIGFFTEVVGLPWLVALAVIFTMRRRSTTVPLAGLRAHDLEQPFAVALGLAGTDPMRLLQLRDRLGS
jgi:hypothetical protein